MLNWGIDTATVLNATRAGYLINSGITFAGRYYCADDDGKLLTPAEAQLLSQNALTIVALFETNPLRSSYFTSAQGTADAGLAIQQATAVGQPSTSAIYFTVDYNAPADDISGCITDYFGAVADAIDDQYAIGVYGSGAVCAALLQSNLVSYTWMSRSTAFSGSSTFEEWSILQGPEITTGGVAVDLDVATNDYGGFTLSS